MVTQPAGAVSGQAFTTQPAVRLLDGAGNPVSQAAVNVTASVTGAGATLDGTPTVATDGSGIATFSGLGITGSAGSYSLDFSATGLTGATSATFTLVVPPTQLGMVTAPAGAASGVAFSTQPVVRLLDAGSNPVTQVGVSVTASITGGGGGATLIGTVMVATDASGQAVFTDLGISGVAGVYSLDFNATSLTGVTSSSFNLAVGPATQVTIVTAPAGAASGQPFTTQPVVRLLDSGGNQVAQAGIDVTASILSGDPTATLDGTTTVQTDGNGVATFSNLGLTGPAGAYEISFGSTGLISASAPIGLAFSIQPDLAGTLQANWAGPGAGYVMNDRLTTRPAAQSAAGNMTQPQGVSVTMAIAREARHAESSVSLIAGAMWGMGEDRRVAR
jgi:hypothetical protein